MSLFLISILITSSQLAYGTVILQSTNFTFQAIEDIPANFGPRIPDEAIVSNYLILSSPEDACTHIDRPTHDIDDPWISLIIRTHNGPEECSFDTKVRHAEQAGAAAVIVYDDIENEELIIMAMKPGDPEPGIPSVFVSHTAGLFMKKLIQSGSNTRVIITPTLPPMWFSMLLSALAGLFAFSMVISGFYMLRNNTQIPDEGDDVRGHTNEVLVASGQPSMQSMTKDQVDALPLIIHTESESTIVVQQNTSSPSACIEEEKDATDSTQQSSSSRHAGDTRRVCVICLELYTEGDKLRVLPCKHRYHKDCIDQWLTSRVPLCPVCKFDATLVDTTTTTTTTTIESSNNGARGEHSHGSFRVQQQQQHQQRDLNARHAGSSSTADQGQPQYDSLRRILERVRGLFVENSPPRRHTMHDEERGLLPPA